MSLSPHASQHVGDAPAPCLLRFNDLLLLFKGLWAVADSNVKQFVCCKTANLTRCTSSLRVPALTLTTTICAFKAHQKLRTLVYGLVTTLIST